MDVPDQTMPLRGIRQRRGANHDKPLHLGCLVAPGTHSAVRTHAAEKGVTIRRLLLTALRDQGVPIPANEIKDGHR